MIRRLVQQQQVAGAHECARELQAHAPAAREAVDGRVELRDLKAQPQNQALRTRGRIVRTRIVQVGVGVGQRFAVVCGFGGFQLGLGGHQARVALQHKVGGAVAGFG